MTEVVCVSRNTDAHVPSNAAVSKVRTMTCARTGAKSWRVPVGGTAVHAASLSTDYIVAMQ